MPIDQRAIARDELKRALRAYIVEVVRDEIRSGELHAFRIGARAFRIAMTDVLPHELGRE